MPRRIAPEKREVLPDPVYNSQLLSKFINVIMKDGKKSVAERILYDALDIVGERSLSLIHIFRAHETTASIS